MASLLHGVENSSAASYVQIHTRVSLWYLREAAEEWRGHGQHWVESWPCCWLFEWPWANPFTFLRPPFPHMWKELGAILGGVLVRSKCLVHEKCLTQGGWEQTPVHSGDGSEGLPWRLSSVIFQRSRRKERCFPHVGPWGLFSDLPLCRLGGRQTQSLFEVDCPRRWPHNRAAFPAPLPGPCCGFLTVLPTLVFLANDRLRGKAVLCIKSIPLILYWSSAYKYHENRTGMEGGS